MSVPAGNQTRSGVDAALALVPAGNLTGTVTDASSGAPVAGVCVYLYPQGQSDAAAYATCTQADGSYGIYGAAPGDYDVAISDQDKQSGAAYFYALHVWKNQ